MLILSKEEMQQADFYTKNYLGLFEELLMENAGQSFLYVIQKMLNPTDKISVFCGSGNNGGDGIVLARRLQQLGFNVRLILVNGLNKFSKATSYHFKVYRDCGFKFEQYNEANDLIFSESDFIIDAIFGIGFHGEPNERITNLFNKINLSRARIISIDIPSGICANSGQFQTAIKAEITLVVSYLKLSAFQYPAKFNYGRVIVVDADITCDIDTKTYCAKTWGLEEFKQTFVFKKVNDNKWNSGRAIIVGGSKNMIGAIILAAKACLSSGVGLMQLAVPNGLRKYTANFALEATYAESFEDEQNGGFLTDVVIAQGLDVAAIGPGLSRNEDIKNVVKKVIESEMPVVLDADALFFLDKEFLDLIKNRRYATILTPHIREMAHICGCDVEFIEKNRFQIAKEKAKEWNCFLVLKGPNTITTTPAGLQFVNLSGNEGLAKGGTGDVLTGIVTAFVAKCAKSEDDSDILNAVCNAVFVHGMCSELLTKKGQSTMTITATDVVSCLNSVFQKLRSK